MFYKMPNIKYMPGSNLTGINGINRDLHAMPHLHMPLSYVVFPMDFEQRGELLQSVVGL